MLKVIGFDASDPLAVVCDFCPRFDKGVEDNVPIKVHDADAGEPIAFLGQDSLTVKSKYLCFSNRSEDSLKIYLLSPLITLVEH